MANKYQNEARFVQTMRSIAASRTETDYWHGYRLGLLDSLPDADEHARRERWTAYDLRDLNHRCDRNRAAAGLGYWDGLRWELLGGVRDYSAQMSVAEWLARYGEVYEISNERHVIDMCAGAAHDIARDQNPLPFPFTAENKDGSWRIRRSGDSPSNMRAESSPLNDPAH